MRMPAIADHLNDRFVKPLAVNRMVSLVEQSIRDARQQENKSIAFEKLEAEVDEYLQDSWGSGVDVPEWLQSLGAEVDRVETDSGGGRPGSTADIALPQTHLTRKDLMKELDTIDRPLRRRRNKNNKRGDDSGHATPKPDDPNGSHE